MPPANLLRQLKGKSYEVNLEPGSAPVSYDNTDLRDVQTLVARPIESVCNTARLWYLVPRSDQPRSVYHWHRTCDVRYATMASCARLIFSKLHAVNRKTLGEGICTRPAHR